MHPNSQPEASASDEPEVRTSRSSTLLLAGVMITLILCICTVTYVGIYVKRSDPFDFGGETAPIRIRYFEKDWHCRFWAPLASLESWVTGKNVRLLSGSILDQPITK